MPDSMHQNPDLVIFKNLIAYYVQRQRLVVLALLDICPIVLTLENRTSILGVDLAPYVKIYEEGRYTQDGIWKNDWRYRHHGIGCELTHVQTGEYFNWDAPDPDACYIGNFLLHLEWRIKHMIPLSKPTLSVKFLSR